MGSKISSTMCNQSMDGHGDEEMNFMVLIPKGSAQAVHIRDHMMLR